VIGDNLIRQLIGRVFLEPTAAPPRYVRIDHRASYVSVKRGMIVDLAPGQVGLGQGRLHQVFGVGPVPGEHDRHSEQRATPGEYVVTEGGVVGAGARFPVIAGAAHADYFT
jgi:hypothetical protein